MFSYTEPKKFLNKSCSTLSLLQSHTSSTTNTGVKAGVLATETVFHFTQNIFNIVPTDEFTP
jgi:hypothetical protein